MAKNFTPKAPFAGQNKFENMSKKSSGDDRRISIPTFPKSSITLRQISTDGAGDAWDGNGAASSGKSNSSADIAVDLTAFMAAEHRRVFQNLMFGVPFEVETGNSLDLELAQARNKVKEYLLEAKHDVHWGDVVGNEKARTALLEALEHPVKQAQLFAHYGIKPSKGVLLFGPPGCGKTMFGKAAATAVSKLHGKTVELLVINGAEIQSMYVGQTEKTIREIFAYARLYHRKHRHQLVIFIDEADAILQSRDDGPYWSASNVATFLTEMDGKEENGAFVILATNRPDALDEALLRDGRCDRKIKVERPDQAAALQILTKAMTGAPAGRDIELSGIVEHLFDPMHLLRALQTPSGQRHHFTLGHVLSGAMVVGLVNRDKGIAMRRDMSAGTRTGISQQDLLQAVDEVLEENKGLNHDFALREFVENVAVPYELAGITAHANRGVLN